MPSPHPRTVDGRISSKTPLPGQEHVRYLRGVGPKRALALEKMGIVSVRDLLYYFPRRYEDRSQLKKISEVTPNQMMTLRGEILAIKSRPLRRMQILEVTIGDETGMIPAIWFNQPYLKKQFLIGQEIILYGKIEWYKNRFQIQSPEFELLSADEEAVHAGRITPIYPLTEGLFQRSLRMTLRDAVQNQADAVIREYLPQKFREQKRLMKLKDAIGEMHFPAGFDSLEFSRKRIVYDEFLIFQAILMKKIDRMKKKYKAVVLTGGKDLSLRFKDALPFNLTSDQEKVISDLIQDLSSTIPMNRLIQGDVGSGKTLMAAFAMALAANNGHQAAFLVPTEILAEQHYKTLRPLLEKLAFRAALLTSSTPVPHREKMTAEVKQGKIQVLIGTHAVLQEDVTFKSLALLVVDEQHKFGVHQRNLLLRRDPRPHQLVMTATPIPRTLAFTVYGDLAVSSIRELPAGRQPVKTYWVPREKQKDVLKHIRRKVADGEQAYFIFPLIDETEKTDLLAAEKEYDSLRKKIFPDIKIGLVHGRMTREQREQMMKEFRQGEIKILVATSVIEVGVDHPNATVMVIENAERFGLAQLHQMRGRIGRGSKPSECFLFGTPTTPEGKSRLQIFTSTQDGFQIAEEDLKIRGPGDFLGTRQSGEPFFRVANPLTDEAILQDARQTAMELVRTGTLETDPEWQEFKNHIEQVAIHY